ncbi:MAG: hypothetical protein HC771_14785 [Synechococcales cyanobacterium CRU_2_2]|nr:hypothetical protein [Synechococcales cyanobacterium CRU_2_2]
MPMDSPIIIRHSELLNRLVLERDTGQEVGRVERLWMYPQAHRVMGWYAAVAALAASGLCINCPSSMGSNRLACGSTAHQRKPLASKFGG